MVAVSMKAIQQLKADNDNLRQQVAQLKHGAGSEGLALKPTHKVRLLELAIPIV